MIEYKIISYKIKFFRLVAKILNRPIWMATQKDLTNIK